MVVGLLNRRLLLTVSSLDTVCSELKNSKILVFYKYSSIVFLMLFVEIKIPHVQSGNHVQLAMTSILRIVRKEKYIQAKERNRLLNRLLS